MTTSQAQVIAGLDDRYRPVSVLGPFGEGEHGVPALLAALSDPFQLRWLAVHPDGSATVFAAITTLH